MKGKRLNSALIGLLMLGLVVPTGAAMPTLTDSVFESNDLVLRPYDGPNGRKYVSSVEDTRDGAEGERNITIDISKVNLEAQTVIDNVFVVANEGDQSLTVWVTHDATAYLTIQRSDTHEPIQGRSNRIDLAPGEEINVGFKIDTRETDVQAGDLLLETITIHVGEFRTNQAPTARLSAPGRAAPGQSITLDASTSTDPDNDTLTYAWNLDNDSDFDDATGPIVRRSFSSLPQTVRVNVSDGLNGFDTAEATIASNQRPNAVISAPATALLNQSVSLSAADSTDPEGGSLTYAWDLDGDGAFDDGTGQSIQHAFTRSGPRSVSVEVTDPVGMTDTAGTTVRINGPPRAALTGSPRQAAAGDTVTLDASGSTDPDGDALSYAWDLDGDDIAERETSAPTIDITIDDPPQTVTVTVTDSTGQSATAELTIGPADNDPPNAALSAPNTAEVGETIVLNADGSSDPDGDPLTFVWDLDGDGTFETTSNVSSLTHSFDSAGDQQVSVRVSDGRGGLDRVSRTISVEPPENETETGLGENDTETDEVQVSDDRNETNVVVQDLENLPSGQQAPPQAVIQNVDPTRGPEGGAGLNASEVESILGQDQSEQVERALRAAGAQAVTEVGRPINLSGTPSIIRSSQAVGGGGKVVQAWDIRIGSRDRTEPVTLRLSVDRSRFPNGSDPANARIGHFTGEGWQLLETRILRITNTQVVFEIEVTTFSPFAVFAENEVEHRWTLPNGSVVKGVNIRTVFHKVGIYNVTLTVTDAFGRSDSTDYRILVNDPPQPEIEVSGKLEPGEPITLTANTSNEIGEITEIVWLFEDGTRVFNESVTVKFGQGRHTIRVVASDVYGSVGSSTTELQIGGNLPPGQSEPTKPGVPNAGAIIIVGLGAAFTFLSGRWAYPGNLAMLRPVAPRVSVLRSPKWSEGVIRIEELRVEDPNGDLERVIITVLDPDENALLEKEIELDPTHSYETEPERIQAPMLLGEDVAGGYEVMVQGFDEKDHSSRQERQAIER